VSGLDLFNALTTDKYLYTK